SARDSCETGDGNVTVLLQRLIRSAHPAISNWRSVCNIPRLRAPEMGVSIEELLALGIPSNLSAVRIAVDRGLVGMLPMFLQTRLGRVRLVDPITLIACTSHSSQQLSHLVVSTSRSRAKGSLQSRPYSAICRGCDHTIRDSAAMSRSLHPRYSLQRRTASLYRRVPRWCQHRNRGACSATLPMQHQFHRVEWQCIHICSLQVIALGSHLFAAVTGTSGYRQAVASRGADNSIQDSRGETAIRVAMLAGDLEIVEGLRHAEHRDNHIVSNVSPSCPMEY
ncbi:hypothetical protein Tdes44962_MAKER02582, partial [Teratosphaeria destructans]